MSEQNENYFSCPCGEYLFDLKNKRFYYSPEKVEEIKKERKKQNGKERKKENGNTGEDNGNGNTGEEGNGNEEGNGILDF